MRKLSCKVCGEKWAGIKGPAQKFYECHEVLHGLIEPRPEEGESSEDYIYRLEEWRQQYFQDTNIEVTTWGLNNHRREPGGSDGN